MSENFRRLTTSNSLDLRNRYVAKIRAKEAESQIDVDYYNSQIKKNGDCEGEGSVADPNIQIGDGGGVDWDVRKLTPEITAEQIYSKIKSKRSDAHITLDTVKHIHEFANKQGINHVFIMAVSLHETGWWTSGVWKNKNNPGGLMKGGKTFYSYSSQKEGYENMISNMTGLPPKNGTYYFAQGKYTVAKIAQTWAPVPASNDPNGLNKHWPGNVVNSMKTFGLDVTKGSSKSVDVSRNENQRSATYSWPVPGWNTVTSKYGNRIHPISGKLSFHTGIDIDTPNNKDVDIVACRDGEVIFAGANGGYGNMVKIRHSDGYETWYAHNKSLKVKKGDTVKQGQAIAIDGTTGNSTGDHLHFEVRSNSSTHVDPQKFVSPDNTIVTETPPTGGTSNCVPASDSGGVDEEAKVWLSNEEITTSGATVMATGKSVFMPLRSDVNSNPWIKDKYTTREYDLIPVINVNSNLNKIGKANGLVPDNIPLGKTPRRSYAITMMKLIQSVNGDLSKLEMFKEIPIMHKSIQRLEKDSSNPYRTYLRKDLIKALEFAHEAARRRGLISGKFILTSGYRTVTENANYYIDRQEDFTAYSPHLGGYGVDIFMPNRKAAEDLGKFLFNSMNFGDVGIGDNFVHVDIGPRNSSIRYYN